MNPLNDIHLTMFSTSVGHYGRHTYKWVLSRFEKLYGLDSFGARTLAVRIHDGNEGLSNEILKNFPKFNILKELGDKKVGENPHKEESSYCDYIISNYCHSVANVFSLVPIKTEFILFQEDDRTLEFNGDYRYLINEAIKLLREDDSVFCIRIGGPDDPIEKGDESRLFLPSPFVFHPFIAKSDKMFNVCQAFKDNYLKLQHFHPEMLYESLAGCVYPNCRFIRFNPKIGYNLNLGQGDYKEVIEKYNLGFL